MHEPYQPIALGFKALTSQAIMDRILVVFESQNCNSDLILARQHNIYWTSLFALVYKLVADIMTSMGGKEWAVGQLEYNKPRIALAGTILTKFTNLTLFVYILLFSYCFASLWKCLRSCRNDELVYTYKATTSGIF